MKKLLIPLTLLIQIVAILTYMRFSDNSRQWDIFYFMIDPICFCILIWSITYGRCCGEYDLHFLSIIAIFNLCRAVCYAGNYLHLIQRTYNFEAISLGTGTVTLMIIISAYRHGHF